MNLSWGNRRWVLLGLTLLVSAILVVLSTMSWKCLALAGMWVGVIVAIDEWSGEK